MAQRPHQKKVSAVVLAELQWTSTDIPYLSLSTCPGESSLSKHKKQEDQAGADQIRMETT